MKEKRDGGSQEKRILSISPVLRAFLDEGICQNHIEWLTQLAKVTETTREDWDKNINEKSFDQVLRSFMSKRTKRIMPNLSVDDRRLVIASLLLIGYEIENQNDSHRIIMPVAKQMVLAGILDKGIFKSHYQKEQIENFLMTILRVGADFKKIKQETHVPSIFIDFYREKGIDLEWDLRDF